MTYKLCRDIARVDDRIRDINRSLAAAETRASVTGRDNGLGRQRHDDQTSVFVRNIPFSVSWQQLKSHFSKVGKLCFLLYFKNMSRLPRI